MMAWRRLSGRRCLFEKPDFTALQAKRQSFPQKCVGLFIIFWVIAPRNSGWAARNITDLDLKRL